MKTFSEMQEHCSLDEFKPYQRPSSATMKKKKRSKFERSSWLDRKYGSLKRVAMPRGADGSPAAKREMCEQQLMGRDVINALLCNAYRIGFKAGRRSAA